jgi:excisionase family DNA binding protein
VTRQSGHRPERPLTRDDVMHATDVAELLRCPKSTVEDWARRNIIPSKKIGRRRIFLRFEVEQWLLTGGEGLPVAA